MNGYNFISDITDDIKRTIKESNESLDIIQKEFYNSIKTFWGELEIQIVDIQKSLTQDIFNPYGEFHWKTNNPKIKEYIQGILNEIGNYNMSIFNLNDIIKKNIGIYNIEAYKLISGKRNVLLDYKTLYKIKDIKFLFTPYTEPEIKTKITIQPYKTPEGEVIFGGNGLNAIPLAHAVIEILHTISYNNVPAYRDLIDKITSTIQSFLLTTLLPTEKNQLDNLKQRTQILENEVNSITPNLEKFSNILSNMIDNISKYIIQLEKIVQVEIYKTTEPVTIPQIPQYAPAPEYYPYIYESKPEITTEISEKTKRVVLTHKKIEPIEVALGIDLYGVLNANN
jgi:hypothetical protein